MRKPLFGIAFLLCCAIPAFATEITVGSSQWFSGSYKYAGSTATLRLYYSQSFLSNTNVNVVGSAVGSNGWYKQVSCAVSSSTLNCDSFTIQSTIDSNKPNTRFFAVLYDQSGARRETLMGDASGWIVPASPTTTTVAILQNSQGTGIPNPPVSYLNSSQVQALINAQVGTLNDASDVVKGRTKLSVAPDSATNPIAVGDNDPRVPTQNENDALVGTSGSPSSSNKFVTNTDIRLGATVFNVKNPLYGAAGDGATNDTAAINLAIAAFNLAGKGVLYFPAGIYKATATLTTITANGSMLGDGGEFVDPAIVAASQINFTSASTNAFNIASRHFLVRGIGLSNTAGTTPTAGYGFNVTGSNLYQKVDFENVSVYRFFHALHEDGGLWHAWNFTATSSVDYQIFVENSSNDDAGDWDIDGLKCLAIGTYPPLCLKIKNGGGKIAKSKILGTVDGIVCVSGANTSLLAVFTTSIELFKGNGITVNGGTPAGSWSNVQLDNLEFEPDPTNTTGFGIAAIATANLQLSNINGNNGSSGAPLIAAGAGSSNWSVGPITISGWGRDIQSGGSYTGAPLPASAVGTVAVASNRINPEYKFFHLTCGGGVDMTKNIFLNGASMSPYDNRNHTISFVPDQPCQWDNTGNIGTAAGTMTVNRLVVAQYIRGDKWYLSQ